MASRLESAERPVLTNRSCSHCTRRKVKCDKADPCSNCAKAQVQCTYEARATYRSRKRLADEDLNARISRYESLMQKHNIEFAQHTNKWIPSELEAKVDEDESQMLDSARPVSDEQNTNTDGTGQTETQTER